MFNIKASILLVWGTCVLHNNSIGYLNFLVTPKHLSFIVHLIIYFLSNIIMWNHILFCNFYILPKKTLKSISSSFFLYNIIIFILMHTTYISFTNVCVCSFESCVTICGYSIFNMESSHTFIPHCKILTFSHIENPRKYFNM